MEHFEIECLLPASAETVFTAWLDSISHTEMTGGEAHITDQSGEAYDAWDGYITGTLLSTQPNREMVFSWRTSEFPEQAPDSRLKVSLEERGDSCLLKLFHSEIPEGQGNQYKLGWHEHYFEPMKSYFS